MEQHGYKTQRSQVELKLKYGPNLELISSFILFIFLHFQNMLNFYEFETKLQEHIALFYFIYFCKIHYLLEYAQNDSKKSVYNN